MPAALIDDPRLRELARMKRVSLACLLLAVVGLLLARRSFRRLQYLRDNEE